jgi:hypothetical protein
METMFEHLDDHDEIDAGARQLARVRNRAADLRAQRRRVLTVGACSLLLAASLGLFLAGPNTARLSASAANYDFNAVADPVPFGFSVPTSALVDINFVSAQNGFGLAAHKGAVLLAMTTDGGADWTVRNSNLPGGFGEQDGFPGQMEFVGSTGYLWGASDQGTDPLWVTQNGGVSWEKAAITGHVMDVSAIGSNVWALTSNCQQSTASVPGSCSLGMAESTDGGTTWGTLPILLPGTPASGSEQQPLELARITQDRAYVVSSQSNATTTGSSWQIAYTDDGGMSWQLRPVPCLPTMPGVELAASGTDDLWLLCGSEAFGPEQSKSLYRSHDGGLTWSLESNAVVSGSTAGTTATTTPANSLPLSGYIAPFAIGHHNFAVLSPTTAWLFPTVASLYETTDGGSQWDEVPDTASAGFTSGGAGNVTFLSATDGWICEYGIGIWHTTDGIHWHPLGS